MAPIFATLLCAAGIAGLFLLNRDSKVTTSKALWIPVVWFLIVGSRDVSMWLSAFGIRQAATLSDLPGEYLEGNPIDRVVYTGLVALGLSVLISRGPQVARLIQANLPIITFFAYCALSAVWSDYSAVSFKRWIKALGDIIMVMVVLSDPDRTVAIKRLLSRTAFLLIPLSFLFAKYYPDLGADYNQHHWTRVYIGVTTNKNFLGVICLLYGLGSGWQFLLARGDRPRQQRTRQMIAHAVILGLGIWLLSMANSMTSWACFLLAGGVMIGTTQRSAGRKLYGAHALVAAAVSIAFAVLFLDIGGGALETVGRDATLTGRTEIWNLALSLAGNSWIGTGFESFWLGKRLETVWSIMPGIQEAHNGYLEVFLNLGWIGTGLVILVVLTGYRNIFASFRRDPQLIGLRLAFFTAAVIYNFTEAGFRMLNPIWSLFLLAVMYVPANAAVRSPSPIADYGTTFEDESVAFQSTVG